MCIDKFVPSTISSGWWSSSKFVDGWFSELTADGCVSVHQIVEVVLHDALNFSNFFLQPLNILRWSYVLVLTLFLFYHSVCWGLVCAHVLQVERKNKISYWIAVIYSARCILQKKQQFIVVLAVILQQPQHPYLLFSQFLFRKPRHPLVRTRRKPINWNMARAWLLAQFIRARECTTKQKSFLSYQILCVRTPLPLSQSSSKYRRFACRTTASGTVVQPWVCPRPDKKAKSFSDPKCGCGRERWRELKR